MIIWNVSSWAGISTVCSTQSAVSVVVLNSFIWFGWLSESFCKQQRFVIIFILKIKFSLMTKSVTAFVITWTKNECKKLNCLIYISQYESVDFNFDFVKKLFPFVNTIVTFSLFRFYLCVFVYTLLRMIAVWGNLMY